MLVLIRKAKIIDQQSEFNGKTVDLLIEHGIIKTIAPHIDTIADQVIDLPDLMVSSGWMDTFADYCEPGFEHKETIDSGLTAAASGGFTDVVLAPNTFPALSTKSAVQYVSHKSQGHAAALHPLGAITQNTEGKDLAEMIDMHTYGAIAFSDGWKPVQNAALMLKALEYVKSFKGTVIQIPVHATLSAGGLMHEGPISTSLGMAGIPVLAESLMVYRDIELLRYTGSKLHISGISTSESVALVRKAKQDGLALSCSVSPYHIALTDEALRSYDSVYKVSPPLRSETDRQALIAALKEGTIDCIASHHRPQEWDAKAREFEYAGEGMNLQECSFNVLWNALQDAISIEQLCHILSYNPRSIFGLEAATIATGKPAILSLFSSKGSNTLQKAQTKSLSANNPFLGKDLAGKVYGIIRTKNVFLNA
jgi:dihydroorotase